MPKSELKVFKKRKREFSGVRKPVLPGTSSISGDEVTTSSRPSTPEPELPSKESVSNRKLSGNQADYQYYIDPNDEQYDLISLQTIQKLLEEIAICAKCKKGKLNVFANKRVGLSLSIGIKCDVCNLEKSQRNSETIHGKKSDINVRMTYAFRCIGKGEEAAKNVCAVMNMPQPTTFKRYNKELLTAAKDVCMDSMKKAVEESIVLNEGKRDIAAIFDGSWQRRGHNSLNGVVTAISGVTGKVIDTRILSKHCRCSNRLTNSHDENCVANYSGGSGGMEVQGITDMFKASVETYNIRYKYFLGDGDSSAYPTVVASEPYGPDFSVEKLECVGHVQKRMGSRLRTLKKKMGKTKLLDDKTIGGKGRLTNAAINQIQNYYGLAIRRNTGSLSAMKQAVWAEYYHLASSNPDPAHALCPNGPDSWCKYKKAIAKGETYNHDEHLHLPPIVMEQIKPIFKDLAHPDLLKRCLHGGTQNACESLNSIIWSRLPKTTFILKNTLEFGIYEAIASYNEGNITKCKILSKLGINPGNQCVDRMRSVDKLRIKKADKAIEELEKKCRQKRTLAKRKLEDEIEEQEDPDKPAYGAGLY